MWIKGWKRNAAGALGLVLTALGATLLVACGGEPASPETPAVVITPAAQSGTTVDAKVGDTVVVKLDANVTTGYEWTLTAGDTFTIASSEYVPHPNPSGLAGSGGTQVVTLKVTAAGSSELTGVYARGWETPSPGSEPDFSMTLTSTE